MGAFIVWIIILLNFILQGTLFQYFNLFGVLPNTSLVIVVCFSLFTNKNKGALYGFVIGLLQDIIYGQALGIYALIYMLIGYGIGLINTKIFRDNLIISFFITSIATSFYILMNVLIMYLLGYEIGITSFLGFPIILQVLYNSIISIFVYFYVLKFYKKRILKF